MRILFVVLVAMLAACSESPQSVSKSAAIEPEVQAPVDSWKVIDAFEVGREVYVRSMALSANSNSLWVGTSSGVHEVDLTNQSPRNTFTRADGLANEYFFAMMVDAAGGKWFGSNGGGASRLQDGYWQSFFPLHGLADYWVYSFAQQANGAVWLGTWNGADR